MTVYAEKLLPHDTEAEESVLGSILIDGECLTRLVPLLKEGDFYRERNQLCFDAALSLFQRDQAVDQITLAGELSRTEKLDLVGGMAYLSHLNQYQGGMCISGRLTMTERTPGTSYHL